MNLAIEELSLAAWPALQTEAYDGWLLRFAEGYTKRSNSVSALYPSTLDLREKIAACEEAYAARGLPTVFKILDRAEDRELEAELEGRGYEKLDETVVRLVTLHRPDGAALAASDGSVEASPCGAPGIARIRVGSYFDPEWIEGYCELSRNQKNRPIIEKILAEVGASRIVVGAYVDGSFSGCGYGALERGYVGVFDIVVAEGARRRGIGELVVRAILGRAVELGARESYLQVVSGNVPAERLYDKLGYREEYRYWYRRRP
jgi:Acetyltransferases